MEVWRKVTTKCGAYVQLVYATTMLKKNLIVVNLALLIFAVIVIRMLAVQLTNYLLTPKVGSSYSTYQKVLVYDADGNVAEQSEYNQVKVYNCNNDSVFYLITIHNRTICNDSSASTIAEFSKLYH